VSYAESFSERAGFDGQAVRALSSATPAVGNELVVVTFYPSDPSFFTAPPAGTPGLTVEKIADRYGLSPVAYSSVEKYFASQGLTVARSSPDRLSLTVEGPAGLVGAAFGTELVSGTLAGRPVTLPRTAPALPSAIEPWVSSVVGLSSGLVSFSLPTGLPDARLLPAGTVPQAAPDLITPAIAREIYDLSSLYNVSGTPRYSVGEGVAVVLWGDGYDPNDISTFFSSDYPASFPTPNVRAFPVDGAPAPSGRAVSDPSQAPRELTLDLEWAGSAAPGATLDAVYAPDGPASQQYSPMVGAMTDALSTAVDLSGVSVISMSFGTPEGSSSSLQTAWATDMATATQRGITMLAATGDLGGDAQSGCTGGPMVEFPSTSPDVIAVGGTQPTLARDLLGQVTGLASESAWSESAGGYSSDFRAPSWQDVGSAAGPIESNGGFRGVPDVSATADYNSLFFAGQNAVAAGTSFATPLWAGLIAEMDAHYGSPLGFLTPRLYAVGASQELGKDPVGLGDVSSGSTCIGSAVTGWDPETGWGSPRALLLYEDLTATFVDLSVSATPTTVAPGGSVTVIVRLTNRTSGAAISGIPVNVGVAASDGNGPCANTWGSATLDSNASGDVSFSVGVPACYLGSHGTATASVTSGGYFGTNSTTVAVNLLGFAPALAGIDQYPWNVAAFAVIMVIAGGIGYVLGRRSPSSVGSYRPPARRPLAAARAGAPGTTAVSPPPATPPGPPPG
jgi:kumamolisin